MIEYITNKPLTTSNLEVSMDKLLEAVNQFCERIYETTEIFIGNPFDLIEIDMSKIPTNYVFISNYHMQIGTMTHVKDGELKRDLYKFIEEHPDRIFKGEKLMF